ncbi:MAG: hypothetical protein NTV52_02115 [Acidobacteria bacterium]|nr:hypothetical protein [Acidobacteriota bacterium]
MELSQTIAELAAAALATEQRIAPSGWRIAAWEATADFQMNQQESRDFQLELQPVNIALRLRRGQNRGENITLRVMVETRASE